VSFLRDLVEKLARPPEEIRAENVKTWAASVPDTVPIRGVKARQRQKVAGVVQNIRIDPREGRDSVEATITDGEGTLIAKWLGRQSLAGLHLGVGLVVEGIAGEQEGDLVVLNPEYELIPGPEHG
jgi:hypothetical protein